MKSYLSLANFPHMLQQRISILSCMLRWRWYIAASWNIIQQYSHLYTSSRDIIWVNKSSFVKFTKQILEFVPMAGLSRLEEDLLQRLLYRAINLEFLLMAENNWLFWGDDERLISEPDILLSLVTLAPSPTSASSPESCGGSEKFTSFSSFFSCLMLFLLDFFGLDSEELLGSEKLILSGGKAIMSVSGDPKSSILSWQFLPILSVPSSALSEEPMELRSSILNRFTTFGFLRWLAVTELVWLTESGLNSEKLTPGYPSTWGKSVAAERLDKDGCCSLWTSRKCCSRRCLRQKPRLHITQ